MEMTSYKCTVCGFTYQAPSYWSDFSPEEELEMEHFDLQTRELCSEATLKLIKNAEK